MGVMRVRWKTLWREDYVWAYYIGAVVLFAGRWVFGTNDLLNLIPLYGLFMTNLVLIIRYQDRRHRTEKIVRLTEWQPLRRGMQELVFSWICALPAGLLLLAWLTEIFPGTPRVPLILLMLHFTTFAVCLAFGLSLLPFKYATLISLLLYFLLVAFNGYRLEYVQYLVPTLNFLYPDYPDYENMLTILLLGAGLFMLYLWKRFDRPKRARRQMIGFTACIAVLYVLMPVGQNVRDQQTENAAYRSVTIEGVEVGYRGVSQRQAERYAQAAADVAAAARREAGESGGSHKGQAVAAVRQVIVTRQKSVPHGDRVEHILTLESGVLHVDPYSNKFYEFNYGYNIVRDLTELLVQDPELRHRTVSVVLREDRHGFFRAARLRAER
ncbi:hypothetical protein CDO73_17950 [Saccharibacillus sp. O23]|uniref:hypothetical protein n=1 Tax=Saccharibacillus sp. O23 TaxID=2009338 RepID=UPI000B6EEE85|nr:hypothetical protein [Saccharibacillus sp. O23]OWR28440.1 hypothetical protein CDO73_17950 [Saccharibacillus sp. O23]